MPIPRSSSIACACAFVFLAAAAQASAATIVDFPENGALKGRAEVAAYAFRSAPPVAKQCAGQANSGTVTLTKQVDGLSPQLAQAAQAKRAVVMMIDDTKADGTRIAYQLTNATVAAIAPQAGGDKPMEQVSFNFAKVQWVTPGCKPAPAPRRAALPDLSGAGGGYKY